MGARYEGNIEELCDIAQPDIAVVTNVGIAHLETFGSQEAIARTKSMLVKRVAKGGSAVLNFKDERVKQMAKLREDINIISTSGSEAGIKASEILYDNDGTRFSVHFRDEKELFQTKLLGKHNVENMLLAVGVASCFNVRLKTMAVAARKIKPVE